MHPPYGNEKASPSLALGQQQIGRLPAAPIGELESSQLGDLGVSTQGDADVTGAQVDGADACFAECLQLLAALGIETQQAQLVEYRIGRIDTTSGPQKRPAGLVGRLVRYIGTFRPVS